MSKTNKRKKDYFVKLGAHNTFVSENDRLIRFSFRYFRSGNHQGESFEEWEKEQILADLNEKLKAFSNKSKEELKRDGTLEVYGAYPRNSGFDKPKDIDGSLVEWSRFRITGRRRLIGFFIKKQQEKETVFYVVFLDKEHQFAISEKSHT